MTLDQDTTFWQHQAPTGQKSHYSLNVSFVGFFFQNVYMQSQINSKITATTELRLRFGLKANHLIPDLPEPVDAYVH